MSSTDTCRFCVLLLLLVVPADGVELDVFGLLLYVVDVGLMMAVGCLAAVVLDSVSSWLCVRRSLCEILLGSPVLWTCPLAVRASAYGLIGIEYHMHY